MIMISAMYENGGNTTHRFLDGHPELFVYPFESQIGNSRINDFISSLYPFKYRYPDFPVSGTPAEDYELFFDEEMKTFLRARKVSKFRDADLVMEESERKQKFCAMLEKAPRTRGNIVAAFFAATFDAWKNVQRTGKEAAYVGYSPVIGFDGEQILTDFPKGHVIHVVRNPWSGYADTIKRPFPLSLSRYGWTWSLMQHFALTLQGRYPDRFHILRFEDLVADPKKAMSDLARKLGIGFADTLLYPSWNGQKMTSVYPWGTIRTPTTEANIATMNELSAEQKAEMKSICRVILPHFGYESFV
ncbi:MAG TPA: sulfotransferase [Dongiaceae bacterium]|nr:sulfotransferase [Dongiaceae bacterium]